MARVTDEATPVRVPWRDLAGHVLASRYELERPLATGGMAQVWVARDRVLDRPVAVKVLHAHLAQDGDLVRRFAKEARSAARLHHGSIVSVYDTISDDGVEAIVMELVDGASLRDYLDEHRILTPHEAIAITAHVADALGAAHSLGVVHRDVKPANILVCEDGRVMVADFGIAKRIDTSDLTRDTMIGTAKYLAPEQVSGEKVGPFTDVYALGVVLYEMVCGRAPFQADSDLATALSRMQKDPPRPRQVRPGVPRDLERVILRAMERRPEQRYASAAEFRAALLAIDPGSEETDQTSPDLDDATSISGVSERSWLVPALAIVVFGVALGIAGLLFGRSETGRALLGTDAADGAGETTGTLDEGTATSAEEVDGAAPGAPTVAGVTSFDPFGDGAERESAVDRLIDGDPTTSWKTERYRRPAFGRLKEGVGFVVELDGPAVLSSIGLSSDTEFWGVVIYVATNPATDLAGWGEPVASAEGIEGSISLPLADAEGSAVLVWITSIAPDGVGSDGEPRWATSISEVQLD